MLLGKRIIAILLATVRDRQRGRKTIRVSTYTQIRWPARRKQLVSALVFKCSVSRPYFIDIGRLSGLYRSA